MCCHPVIETERVIKGRKGIKERPVKGWQLERALNVYLRVLVLEFIGGTFLVLNPFPIKLLCSFLL